MRILVTGATGIVGRRVVGALADAGATVRATSRTPADADLPAAEVFDTAAPAQALLDGCDAALITAAALGDDPESRFAEILETAGSAHIVLLSSASAADPDSPTGRQYRPLEELVSAHEGPWTLLRSVPFALNTAHWWSATIRAGGFVDTPYPDVRVAPVDERDVADAAAGALLGPARGALTLTGPQRLSSREQVEIVGAHLGVRIAVHEITPDQVRERLTSVGVPRWAVDGLLRSFEYAAEHGIVVTDTVAELTGRPARSYADWVGDHAAAFS